MNLTWLCNLGIQKLYYFSLWCEVKSCEKKLYAEIAHYRKCWDCPIYTCIMSPQQYHCSLSKVRTYTRCKLLTSTVAPPVFTSLSVLGQVSEQGRMVGHGRTITGLWGYFPWCVVSNATTAGGLRSFPLFWAPDDLHGICSGNPWRRPAHLHLCLCGQI